MFLRESAAEEHSCVACFGGHKSPHSGATDRRTRSNFVAKTGIDKRQTTAFHNIQTINCGTPKSFFIRSRVMFVGRGRRTGTSWHKFHFLFGQNRRCTQERKMIERLSVGKPRNAMRCRHSLPFRRSVSARCNISQL